MVIFRQPTKVEQAKKDAIKAEKARQKKLKTRQKYEQRVARADLNRRIEESNESSKPRCPKCTSTNIQFLGRDRKGFSVGKAVGGAILTGGVGSLAGFAGKKGKFQWLCMDCGNRFEMK